MINKITYGVAIAAAVVGLAVGYSEIEPLATANTYNAQGTGNNEVPAQLIVMEPMYLQQDHRMKDAQIVISQIHH